MILIGAVKQIDSVFGDGFAKANPVLVGAILLANALKEIDKTLVGAVENVTNATGKINLLSLLR